MPIMDFALLAIAQLHSSCALLSIDCDYCTKCTIDYCTSQLTATINNCSQLRRRQVQPVVAADSCTSPSIICKPEAPPRPLQDTFFFKGNDQKRWQENVDLENFPFSNFPLFWWNLPQNFPFPRNFAPSVSGIGLTRKPRPVSFTRTRSHHPNFPSLANQVGTLSRVPDNFEADQTD